MFRALPLDLQRPASTWYNAVHSTITSYHIFLQRLKQQFNSDASKWVLRQQLASYCQTLSETVSAYSTDIRQLCQRLGMQAADCLHHFVMGLRPEIQSHVILAQPENFDQAENLAKLKETTLNTTSWRESLVAGWCVLPLVYTAAPGGPCLPSWWCLSLTTTSGLCPVLCSFELTNVLHLVNEAR